MLNETFSVIFKHRGIGQKRTPRQLILSIRIHTSKNVRIALFMDKSSLLPNFLVHNLSSHLGYLHNPFSFCWPTNARFLEGTISHVSRTTYAIVVSKQVCSSIRKGSRRSNICFSNVLHLLKLFIIQKLHPYATSNALCIPPKKHRKWLGLFFYDYCCYGQGNQGLLVKPVKLWS